MFFANNIFDSLYGVPHVAYQQPARYYDDDDSYYEPAPRRQSMMPCRWDDHRAYVRQQKWMQQQEQLRRRREQERLKREYEEALYREYCQLLQQQQQQQQQQQHRQKTQKRKHVKPPHYRHRVIPVQQDTVETPIDLTPYHKAASVIQNAYRQHRHERHDKAALAIQQAYRQHRISAGTKSELFPQLRKIRDLREECNRLYTDFVETRGVLSTPLLMDEKRQSLLNASNRNFLQYEDGLLKLMIRADSIDSAGNELIRDFRKALVNHIQSRLDEVDHYRDDQLSIISSSSASSSEDEGADSDSDMESMASAFDQLYGME